MVTHARFHIDGISCGGCVRRIENTMADVAGVTDAQVNFAAATATAQLADPASGRALVTALSVTGYQVRPEKLFLDIDGITCGACVARVETALMEVPGVLCAVVNLADRTASVQTLADTGLVYDAIAQAGYQATLRSVGARDDRQAVEIKKSRDQFILAAALTLPVFLLEMGGHAVPQLHHWIARTIGTQTSWSIQFILTTLVLLGPGRGFFTKGIPALWRGAPDMNSLVVLGASAAWGLSLVVLFVPNLLPVDGRAVYFEAAAMIVTLILLGRWLEARAKGQTGAAIARLIELRPQSASVLRDGGQVDVPIMDLVMGDVIVTRPGERIATDGVICTGASFIDESMISGEAVPVEKHIGDPVVGGTINGNGVLQIRATAVGANTVLSQIIGLVTTAQSLRLPLQNIVNKITAWFVPAVMVIAVLTVVIWALLGPSWSYAILAGVSVLIIACPCAMGLATPLSIMVGTGRAADMGILFRKGDALQALQAVDVVAFDKTGTLTVGKPTVTDVLPVSGGTDDFMQDVAAVEALSEHPLARAIIAASAGPLAQVTGFENHPGAGLSGGVAGRSVRIGTPQFLSASDVDTTALQPMYDRLAQNGKTPIMVAINGAAAGVVGIADRVRDHAAATIAALQARGIKVIMITGDNAQTAAVIGATLAVDDIVAGVLPAGKVDAIRALQSAGAKVAFVGDGINDGPALAAAQVGLAIGTGTDVAIETADVVLMSGDPRGVLNSILISTATLRNIRQNLGWAFGYNVVLIPVAAGCLYPLFDVLLSPILAAGAMALSSVLVGINALRLWRFKEALK